MAPASAELSSEQPSNFRQVPFTERLKAHDAPAPAEPSTWSAAPDDMLMQLDWAAELRAAQGVEPVVTAGALLSPGSKLPPGHLFTNLLRQGMVGDLTCLYDRPKRIFHSLMALGPNVCGHAGLVHGGMSATIMDETLGALVYMLKRGGDFGGGPAFTARLEVDYRKPLPAPANVCCTARIISIEGRKAWVSVELADRPGGTLFAEGKALFVSAREKPAEPSADKAAGTV